MTFNLKLNVNGNNSGYMINRWGRETISVPSYPTISGINFSNYQLQQYRLAVFHSGNKYVEYHDITNTKINPSILPVPLEFNNSGGIGGWDTSTIMPIDEPHSSRISPNINYRNIGYDNNNWDFLSTLVWKLGNQPIIPADRTANMWPHVDKHATKSYKTVLFYYLDKTHRVYQIDHNLKSYPGIWKLTATGIDIGNGKVTPIKPSPPKYDKNTNEIDTSKFTGPEYDYGAIYTGYGLYPKSDHNNNIGTRIFSNNNVIIINLYNDDGNLFIATGFYPWMRNMMALVHLVGNNNIVFINYHGIMRYQTSTRNGVATTYGIYAEGSNNMIISSAPGGCDFSFATNTLQGMFHHLGARDSTNALYLGNYNYNYNNIAYVVPAIRPVTGYTEGWEILPN